MSRDARLVPRFAREGFGPGELVEGVLVVREPVERVSELSAHLRYVDRSPHFAGAVTLDSQEPLHRGPIEQGQEIPFALRLPNDALPNWHDPSTAKIGTLSWSLVIEADIERGLDTTTSHSVPVNPDARIWRGPDGTPDGEIKATVKRWDVAIEPDRWILRRGEQLNVTVSIGEPAAGRDGLELGLMCQADYDVEYATTDSEGDRDVRRETRHATMFEEWPKLDTGSARQTVAFQLPNDGPFSYDGSAFGFRWFVVAREARRLRTDPHRSARLRVLP